jgi:3'-phosphoadenosine 5'-phosphosulfate (PAPS) 3'-phosphatase
MDDATAAAEPAAEAPTASPVSLLDLAAAALSSAIVAADQITALARRDDAEQDADHKNVRLKNDGSFVTDADLAAQQIIVDAIRKISTTVRVVGEESEEEMKNHAITGHEDRSERMYRLCRQEVDIRYHQGTTGCKMSNTPMPLAQTQKKNGPQQHESQESPDLITTLGSDNLSPPNLRASVVSRDSAGVGLLQEPLEIYEVDASRVSVFIDPLDGTKAYAKGDYASVSILIAIILDRIPCFGVICKPFGYPGQSSVLDTGCVAIYGGTLLGGAFTAGGSICNIVSPPSLPIEISQSSDAASSIRSAGSCSSPSEPAIVPDSFRSRTGSEILESPRSERPSMEELPRAVISGSRSKGIVQDFVTHLGDRGMINPQPLLISGAGEKSLRIILRSENEGLWFFPKAGTSLWDVAASDALLRATGGRLTDKNGNDMDYSKSRTEAENEDGVVACYDQRLHAECIRLFLEGSWHDTAS